MVDKVKKTIYFYFGWSDAALYHYSIDDALPKVILSICVEMRLLPILVQLDRDELEGPGEVVFFISPLHS